MKEYQADVVIIGGGAMGLGIAYQLAKDGMKHICLIEQEDYLGGKNTLRCAGGFRHQFSSKVNIELSIMSYQIFQELCGNDSNIFHNCGYMFALTEEDSLIEYQKSVELQNSLGIDSKWLSKRDIKKLIPIMNTDSIQAATYYHKDGLIDVGSIISFYIRKLKEYGIQILTNSKVKNIERCSSGTKIVYTDSAQVKSDIVVNAAGSGANEIGRMLGLNAPVIALKEQLFVTSEIKEFKETYPVVIFPTSGLGFHKDGTGILSGLHMEENDGIKNVNREWELENCKRLVRILNCAENASIVSRWTGYYDMTPDYNPIIGEEKDMEGIFNAFGFSGHGLMHSSAVSVLISEMINRKETSIDISELSSERFNVKDVQEKEIFKV